MSRRIRCAVLLLLATALVACEKATPPEPRVATSLRIDPALVTLSEAQTQRFTAVVLDQHGKEILDATEAPLNGAVSWRSSLAAIQIDASGLATAAPSFLDIPAKTTVGNTGDLGFTDTITATVGALRATAIISVVRRGTFNVWPDTNVLYAGTTRKLVPRVTRTLNGYPGPQQDDVSGPGVAWSSTDANVVAVDPTGAITAVSPGHARIVAKYSETKTEANAEVYVQAPPATPLRFTSTASSAPWIGRYNTGSVFGARGCGVATEGSIYCWGATLDSTQVTDRCEGTGPGGVGGAKTFRFRCSEIPLRLQTDLKFSSVVTLGGFATFGDSGCGLATTKRVYCWGTNGKGELGIGVVDAVRHGIAPIVGNDEFTELRGSETVCGIRTDGALRCWGGVFGPSPVTVATGKSWRTLAEAGDCGLASDSTAFCFRSGTAQSVGGATRWKSIATANGSPCAMGLDDGVYCGSDLQTKQATAQPIVRLVTYARRFGSDFGFANIAVCGLSSTGDLLCPPQIGPSAWVVVTQPVKLNSLFGHCAIAVDLKVYCETSTPGTLELLRGQ